MDPKQGKSKAKLIVGVSIVAIVLFIIAGAVYALIVASAPKQTENNQSNNQSSSKPITQQALTQNIDDLNSSIKDAQDSQKQATDAVNNASKQTKVSQ